MKGILLQVLAILALVALPGCKLGGGKGDFSAYAGYWLSVPAGEGQAPEAVEISADGTIRDVPPTNQRKHLFLQAGELRTSIAVPCEALRAKITACDDESARKADVIGRITVVGPDELRSQFLPGQSSVEGFENPITWKRITRGQADAVAAAAEAELMSTAALFMRSFGN